MAHDASNDQIRLNDRAKDITVNIKLWRNFLRDIRAAWPLNTAATDQIVREIINYYVLKYIAPEE